MGIGSFAVFLKEKRGGGAGVEHGRFQRAWELPARVCFRGSSEPSTRYNQSQPGTGESRRHTSNVSQTARANNIEIYSSCPHAASLGDILDY